MLGYQMRENLVAESARSQVSLSLSLSLSLSPLCRFPLTRRRSAPLIYSLLGQKRGSQGGRECLQMSVPIRQRIAVETVRSVRRAVWERVLKRKCCYPHSSRAMTKVQDHGHNHVVLERQRRECRCLARKGRCRSTAYWFPHTNS